MQRITGLPPAQAPSMLVSRQPIAQSRRELHLVAPSRNSEQDTSPILSTFLKHAATQSAAVLLVGLAIASPGPAIAADDTGNDDMKIFRSVLRAPAEFYRSRQQANGGSFLLRPIHVSRQRLEAAAAALDSPQGYSDALQSVRAASMECVVFDFERTGKRDLTTASSADQEYKLGDPCKLRLVVKNATTLTKDRDLKDGTEFKMKQILRQFQLLEDLLERGGQGDAQAISAVPELLKEALQANREFEAAIKQCLGLEV